MYKGIKGEEAYPYVLRGEKDDASPTVWMLHAQKVQKGNRNLAGYMKSQGKSTDDAVAQAYTKQDLNQFLSIVESVHNFCFADESAPAATIDDPEQLKKVFFELDFNSLTEILNASRDIFMLREGEKKESSSSYGAASNESTAAGSDLIARDVSSNT